MLRRLWLLGTGLFIAAIAAVALFGGRVELAGFAAARASAALGREVTIGSLRLVPGWPWIGVILRDARLANAENGSEPAMATLSRLSAELRATDVLFGRPAVLRRVEVEGFSLLLEHGTGPDRDRPNWRFGPPHPAAGPPDRSGLPLLLDATLGDAELVFRTSSGNALRIRLDTAQVSAPGEDRPITLEGKGSYNETPLQVASTSAPIRVLRQTATPYPVQLTATGGETRLFFDGTMTDPLNADGAAGTLELVAPTMAALLSIGGADMTIDAALELSGAATRQGDLWRLTSATGTLSRSPLSAPLLELTEGAKGQPDRVTAELSLERLDLNRMLGPPGPSGGDADLPLILDPQQDPLVTARVSVGALAYAKLRATEVRLAGSLGAGTGRIDELSLVTSGAHVTAQVESTAIEGGGASITAQVSLADGDLETMRRTLGLHPLPLSGKVDGRILVAARGEKLNAAARTATLSAVIGLRQGSIAREVIEMASTDLRLLFRTPRGQTPMRCLLAVLSMRDGIGEVAPLRIRSAEGTITGMAHVDLFRERLDAVIGSARESTDFWALDVPMRIWGRFADPEIRPASWSAEGRAKLAAAERMAPLPPDLRAYAQRNPCARAPR